MAGLSRPAGTPKLPDLPFANPNGVPDWEISHHEARLWLTSEQERKHGTDVHYNEESERWVRDSQRRQPAVLRVPCTRCGTNFEAKRSTARYCSKACENRASRAR